MQEDGILAQAEHQRFTPHHAFLAAIGILATLGMAAAIAVAPAGNRALPPLHTVVQELALDHASIVSTENATFIREERIQRGDTLATLLKRLGIHDSQTLRFLRTSPEARLVSQQFATGKTVLAASSPEGSLQHLIFPLNGGDSAVVVERKGDHLFASEQALRFEKRVVTRSAEIRHSLFGATDASDIPDSIAIQLAEIFSGDIDFHRDLRKGDHFSVVYEMNYLRGRPAGTGRILAAEFVNGGKTLQAIYFEQNGKSGYYSTDGKSLKKAFLRAPLEFSRISSGFGMRRHPIHLDRRSHKGIDYAAPTGTKVRAVGDGMVDFIGKQGGYGNLVILRHHGRYSTAYGHLNGFAHGLKKGSHVSQGDIIGFVGSTGWATGPHLHYEFRIGGQQVNPLSVALPTALPIPTSEMPRFRSMVQNVMPQIELVGQAQLASARR